MAFPDSSILQLGTDFLLFVSLVLSFPLCEKSPLASSPLGIGTLFFDVKGTTSSSSSSKMFGRAGERKRLKY